jgi:hypothetical protein
MTTVELLRAARTTILEKRWTTGRVWSCGRESCCALGALIVSTGLDSADDAWFVEPFASARRALTRAVVVVDPHGPSDVAEYNDYTARSKYDILRLYDVAISQELMPL